MTVPEQPPIQPDQATTGRTQPRLTRPGAPRQLALTLGLLLLQPLTLLAASFEASVDRTRLVEGETLELTLETSAGNRFNRPDLTPLEEHFQIQGTRQLSLVSQINGRSQPATRWIITLLPKHTGYLIIPALGVDEQASEPIALQVLSTAQAAEDDSAQLAPLFIDSEVDIENPYVQAQVLLTLRIYHSVSLYDDSSLSGLDIPQARVESLGPPRHYERLINGVRHGVIEVRYALFPEHSGPLEIPSQLFSATVLQARDSSERFSPRTGRLIQVRSPSITLDVRPIPASYPDNAPWLPARNLNLEQGWQPEPDLDLLTGEPLTRTLTISAEGVNASQLPSLQSLNPALEKSLRQYADQPRLESRITEAGVQSQRQDSAALVAQREGIYALPAVEVHWWDTQQERLRTSRLEAVSLSVLSSESFTGSASPVVSAGSEPAGPRLWPWQLATALLGMGLLACLSLLHQTRRTLRQLEQEEPEDIVDIEEPGNPLIDLQAACRANQPSEARKALEAWARLQHSEGLIGLAQQHPELAEALDELNACLFGQNDAPWRSKPLWRAVRMIVQMHKRQQQEPSDNLASLYPDV